jgi:AraC-like DNA-binding protein
MEAIPLIRARYLQAFARATHAVGGRPQRLAEELGIPEKVFEDPDAVHPANQLFAFAGMAARATGRKDLGLVAGRAKLEAHGDFGTKVIGSPTLHQAMVSFCTEALKEYSRAFFWIQRRGETIWFCRHKIDGDRDERLQVELYLVELMLQTVRTVAGPQWQPREIWLQTDEVAALRDTKTLARLNVSFSRPILAIPVPRRLISRTIPRTYRSRARVNGQPPRPERPDLPTQDLVESMEQVVRLYLGGSLLTIDVLAEAVGVSVRTLQRRLSAAGTTFSRLVGEVRMRTALPLLEDPSNLLTEIAFDLGYSHPAHFTRAFRRWAGMTPSEYRIDRCSN